MTTTLTDPRAPMSSAPMKFDSDGQVDWGNMWDSFCVLALEGGPPHRATRLAPADQPDPTDPTYLSAASEIARGIAGVCGLPSHLAAPGWIAMECGSAGMARWLAEAIEAENVSAHADGPAVLLPVDGSFRLEGEIKNVVTAVAKTTHYWTDHVPTEAKQTLAAEAWLGEWSQRLRRRLSFWRRGTSGV